VNVRPNLNNDLAFVLLKNIQELVKVGLDPETLLVEEVIATRPNVVLDDELSGWVVCKLLTDPCNHYCCLSLVRLVGVIRIHAVKTQHNNS
jgi:hypothetical protein